VLYFVCIFTFTESQLLSTEANFDKYYQEFVKCLPMDDPTFLDNLYSQDFLSGDMKNKIESMETKTAKASYFLDQVIVPSLTMNNNNLLERLIKLIGDSESEVLQDLYKTLRKMSEDAHHEESKCICNTIM